MTFLKNISIKNKLIIIILIVTFFAIGIGFSIIMIINIQSLKDDIAQNAIMNAKMIGEYSVTALAFQDTVGANDCLTKLNTIPSISNGIIYNEKGSVFARYDRNQEYFVPPQPAISGSSTFDKKYFYVFQPIEYKGITYGTIYLRVSTTQLSERINSTFITLIILLACLVSLSFILAFQLQNIISKPILKLTSVIKKISTETDLSLRVTKMGSDEIGVLYDGFNTMLEQLHTREIERNRAEKEKENLHAQLLQSQKMEALGKLAGGIAHDFNNLLTIIYGYDQFLLDRLEHNTSLWDHAEKIRKVVEQSAALTHQLLALSRKQELEPKVIDLNAVLIDIEKMLEHVIGENIELVTVLEPGIKRIKVDPGQLKQVILNLMVNARDAMPEGGEITIKTENIIQEENHSFIDHEERVGNFICLSVMDTGIGIDKAILGQIFDPFFTTKEIGLGTGLGLSVVYGIIKQNNGWIDVDSKPGQGTTFMIYFPAVTEKLDEEIKGTIDLKDLRGNGERILLVEDEADIRQFAAIALRENGYCIFECANAKEALNIFKNENGNFKLIFSDVVLPDMTGVQLVDNLLQREPNLQVVLCSGYIGQKSQWAEIKDKGFVFLQKPYHISELLKAIKEVGIENNSHSKTNLSSQSFTQSA